MVKYVESIDEFKEYVGSGKVVMDFYAEWCGPCKMLTPVLEEVSKKLEGQVRIVKCDIDKFPEIASAFKVMSVPTLIYFQDGKAITADVGLHAGTTAAELDSEAQKKSRIESIKKREGRVTGDRRSFWKEEREWIDKIETNARRWRRLGDGSTILYFKLFAASLRKRMDARSRCDIARVAGSLAGT